MKQRPMFCSQKRTSRFINRLLLILISQAALSSAQEDENTVFTLSDCVHRALQKNPEILASGLTVDESRTRMDEVKAGFYPGLTLSVTGSLSERENSINGAGTMGSENISGGLSARYTIFQGFKQLSLMSEAKSNYQSNRAQHRADRDELVLTVIESYYRLLQAERLVTVAEQSLERAKMHLDFAGTLFENGLAARSDVLKAKVEHSDVRLSLIRARNTRLAVQGQLNLVMGRAVQLALKIVDDLETSFSSGNSSSIHHEDFDVNLQMAFQNRPELKRIEAQMNARRAGVRIARSDYFPTISVDGSHIVAGSSISDLVSSSYIGVNLSYPLFSGFARPARIKQENLALRNLHQQQESLRQQISMEVWNAHLQVKEANERVLNSRVLHENALESRDIAEGEYREGVSSMLDVLDAQTAFVNAEQTLIEALADHKIAMAVLDRAVGKAVEEEIQK